MAKLYAELSSDKGGRKATKGGDLNINIDLTLKNVHEYRITYTENGLIVNDIFNRRKTTFGWNQNS